MEEALEALDVVADSELAGVFVLVLRIVGVLAVLAGLGLWLFTDAGILVLPAVLVVLGLILVAVPGLLLELGELAG